MIPEPANPDQTLQKPETWQQKEANTRNCKTEQKFSIDDYAKDGGEELFTKMHCVL